MALLADDELGLAVNGGHLGLPFDVLVGARPRLLVAEVVFLAEHEQHHIGVLLDRAGFAQVRKLRALVVAVLDLARKLRTRNDRHVEFFRERLQVGGDLGHLLHAALLSAPRGAGQELDVVDHQEVHAALALEPPRPRRKLRDREAAGLVDEERQVLQLDRDVFDLLEFLLVDAAAADGARRNAALLGDDAGGKLLGRHFQREEADDSAVDGIDVAVGAHLAAPCTRDVVGDIGGERGLAHTGTTGEDDQIG